MLTLTVTLPQAKPGGREQASGPGRGQLREGFQNGLSLKGKQT